MSQLLTNHAQIDYQYETSGTIVDSKTQTNSVTTTIIEPNLSILKTSCPNYFGPNSKITFNIYISNSALSTIYNVTIYESSQNYFSYIPGSAVITYSDGTVIPINESNNPEDNNIPLVGNIINESNIEKNSFGFKIGNLAPNTNIMISYSVEVNNSDIPESITAYSTAYYSLTDSLSSLRFSVNSNEIILTKAFALITASKSVDKESAFCGDNLCYKILLSNTGNIDATNVRICDPLPNEFRLNNVKFKIADLPYNTSYNVDENNVLTIPAWNSDDGLCIPANTDDNCISIYGTIDCN